eukprot:5252787-Pyramimonas_sp.AAC.1
MIILSPDRIGAPCRTVYPSRFRAACVRARVPLCVHGLGIHAGRSSPRCQGGQLPRSPSIC